LDYKTKFLPFVKLKTSAQNLENHFLICLSVVSVAVKLSNQ